jgi:hypothetical protein
VMLRRRRLTEDENVEISGRDLGECQMRAVPIARQVSQFDPTRTLRVCTWNGASCP